MQRRWLLRVITMLPLLSGGVAALFSSRNNANAVTKRLTKRVRPTDRQWPKAEDWAGLNQAVGGRLAQVHSPLAGCVGSSNDAGCAQVFAELRNPFYIGDEAGLTQTLGWVDAWTCAPSAYAVAAINTNDVVAAVTFARERNLRLVVKGGGHSYQGNSNAADSLLIWTRHMTGITVHDAFLPYGCTSTNAKQAVSVEAGAIWRQVYGVVTTQHGRYVQGGGCTTVGVAGLVQSGGFGSFSKGFGSVAGSLLEAEVVTADGMVRIANSCRNPDLFWSIKGGGGGSFGVVTRVTLETHELPNFVGIVNATIQARTDAAFPKLIKKMLTFYRESLLNPHWGEQIILKANLVLTIQMVFQGLSRKEAEDIWAKFFLEITNSPDEFMFISKPIILDLPARNLWNTEFLKKIPGVVKSDDRPGADPENFFWAANEGECGQVLHGYDSVWLPATLLDENALRGFTEALCAAAGLWQVSLHVNKGLAGAPSHAIRAARTTATNPAFIDAFALAIMGAEEAPAFPGVTGHEVNVFKARADANAINQAMAELRKILPEFTSYVSESNYFEKEWQRAFWGENYEKLLAIKTKYDPEDLFFVHHGVGSEPWSKDGFTRLA